MQRRTYIKSVSGLAIAKTLLFLPLFNAMVSAQDRSSYSESAQWRMAEQNLRNSRSQKAEHSLDPANVNRLKTKWVFTTGGDVSATPTVGDNAVYFPDSDGNLFAVEKDSGRLIWSSKISDYDGALELSLVSALQYMEMS